MSRAEMMKQSAKREADGKLKPQHLSKEVETLAAVVQTFRVSVSEMDKQAQATKANLSQIRKNSELQHRRTTRTILLTGIVTGLVCMLLMSLIVWFTSPLPRSSSVEVRLQEILANPNVPQETKDWLRSNLISPQR